MKKATVRGGFVHTAASKSDVYRASIGKASHGRLVMDVGVYTSEQNALAALRICLPQAQRHHPDMGFDEDDFIIEEERLDPYS